MASRGTKDSKGPGSIDLGKSKQQSTAGTTADGKTPTQEMHRFHGNDDNAGGSSLSKRRGSDSLSIGTPSFTSSNTDGNVTSAPSGSENPVLPRTRPSNLSAVASVNAANAAAAGKAMDNPNALGLKRPSPTPTPGVGSKATAISDEDDGDDDDNHSDTISDTSAGDQGDDEGDSSKTVPSNGGREDGAATPQPPHHPSTQQYHQQQQQQHHHHHYNNHSQQHHHQSQQSYMNIPAHERGRTHNGHDLELNGVQPMRPRQHQRTSTASSIASSSRKERDHMRPFPTPGMKTPNGRHQQHGNQNGHGHSAEKDPFDEIKSVEECRLVEANEKKRHWKRWGPYLSERQWVSAISTTFSL